MKETILRAFVLIILGVSVNGCVVLALGAAATAGAGGAVYAKGQLKDTLDATVPEVHRAARSVIEDMGVDVTADLQDEFSGQLQGELADGTNVWIDSERVTAATTRITIRVGYMGDQAKSSDVLERIKSRAYGL